jgi:pimeloyl-ACP methyl ester carboxylesterase
VRVAEHTTTLDDVPVFYRSAEGSLPVLYLHDAITSSDDLLAFLERTGGVAPDLIGFGRSAKGGHLDYSPSGIIDFLSAFLRTVELDRLRVVGHGWGGALGLLLAARNPKLIERLVLIDAVPLLEGFTWHRAARLWRRPVVGELVMGATSRRMLARQLRRGTTRPDAWAPTRLKAIWEQFDQGTQRALLRLHRAAGETQLAELGAELAAVTAPALVVWGDADPWFPASFADAYAARLNGASVEHIPEAGHWPWLDQPQVIDLVAAFLSRP